MAAVFPVYPQTRAMRLWVFNGVARNFTPIPEKKPKRFTGEPRKIPYFYGFSQIRAILRGDSSATPLCAAQAKALLRTRAT